jgi:hypothetical protein
MPDGADRPSDHEDDEQQPGSGGGALAGKDRAGILRYPECRAEDEATRVRRPDTAPVMIEGSVPGSPDAAGTAHRGYPWRSHARSVHRNGGSRLDVDGPLRSDGRGCAAAGGDQSRRSAR